MKPQVAEILFFKDRTEFRGWLEKNHESAREAWLLYPNKSSGQPRLPYDDAVEKALCFGWIDGQVCRIEEMQGQAQRFTPRRSKSSWSELNKERCRRLIAAGRMTPAGLKALGNALDEPFVYPEDIMAALQANPDAWRNFQKFPEYYKRIRIGYIDEIRRDRPEFQKRLDHFLAKTEKNVVFGTLRPDAD